MQKKILVFSGSRADFGILKPLIIKINKDNKIKLILALGSHHFSKKLGLTANEIIKNKIKIDYSCNIKTNQTNFKQVINYCGKSMIQYSRFIEKKKPDLVVLLGDRYEVFSFCIASFFLNVPIAHLHGGELTEGAFDDTLRHSITKMSNYHFVCHETYKKRVIQLGENPKNVFNYGALSLENAAQRKFTNKSKLFKMYKIPSDKKVILATFHPETRSKIPLKKQKITLLFNSFNHIPTGKSSPHNNN